jgi:FkbM family methyltransferase
MIPIPVKTIPDRRGKPVQFIPEPGVESFLRHILGGHEYPIVFPDVFHPQTIVDIGAHVGSAALWFRYAYPQARIYCFEPNPVSFELLQRNVAGEPGIEILQIALGASDARMPLFSGAYSTLQASLIANEENQRAGTIVEVRSVKTALDEMNIACISVLKVDTEGMELPILRGLGANLWKIEVIYLEYHSERDRRELDQLLGDRFILFASQAVQPDRGTVCYVAADRLARWQAQSTAPRFVFPKQPMSP